MRIQLIRNARDATHFLSSGATNPPLKEVGPTIVFDEAVDGEHSVASAFDQRRIAPHNLKYEKHILPHERRRGIDSFELGIKRVPGPLNRVPGNSQEPDDLNGWKRSEMPTFEMLLKLGSLLRVKEKNTPAAKASERWYLAATEIPLCVSRTVRPFL